MHTVIPESKTYNRVFTDPRKLVRFAFDRAENARWQTDSNAFVLLYRIEVHPRGWKLVSLFYIEKGLVAQMQRESTSIHTAQEVEDLAFVREWQR